MRFGTHVAVCLASYSSAVSGAYSQSVFGALDEIPPRNPPIVNPIRAPYQDPKQPTWLRVEDLLSRMPMREKMAQLMQGELQKWVDFETGSFNISEMKDHMFYHSGMLRVSHPLTTAEISYQGAHLLQDWIMNDTSLSLPAIVQSEGLHGLGVPNATIFPSPIGLGASWNPELVGQAAQIIGQEARALGITQLFAPSADLARDTRHGRVEESMSEDPHLAGEMVAQFVKGLWKSRVAAIVKHFVAFGNSEQGINMGPVHGGERELRTTYLPPFRKAVEAGAFTVMTSYNSYDGIPSVMNKLILTDVLRGEWDFQYWTTTDYGAPNRLCTTFKMCNDNPIDAEAITMKILPAGQDTESGGSFNFDKIPDLVNDGSLHISFVDEAVRRVLRAKFDMGLFEDPFPAAAPEDWPNLIHTDKSLEVAKQLDLESIVLLENHNNVLPLNKTIGSIAVVGPFADTVNYGDYTMSRPRGVTPLDGIRSRASQKTKVRHAKGCEAWSNDESGIREATELASSSDVAIVVVGTWARSLEGQHNGWNATTGESYDTNHLGLFGAQGKLVQQVAQTGVPTIVVFSSGKPIAEPWVSNTTAALLQQFYTSENGGEALADVLFGYYNPSGRLPLTFPRDVGSLPATYDYLDSGREVTKPGHVNNDGSIDFGHTYVTGSPMPWYEFGYGQSYSSFEYSKIELSNQHVEKTDNISVSVQIKNTSDRDGIEVVQLYVTDPVTSVVTPNKQLKAFKKALVKSGETTTITLELAVRDLGLWNQDMHYVVEPGEFVVFMGRSAGDLKQSASFYVM
ncbi:glycoside hydrolase superfamily [Aspergillus ambiguus]|uniref:glycoside hydrolase superfamily n=1 Tax=Aspergillus ambiguus TaxID=176160 RepID=UPI003CCE0CA1